MILNANSPAMKVKSLVCALAVTAAMVVAGHGIGPGARGPGGGPGWGVAAGMSVICHAATGQVMVRGNRYFYHHGRFYRPGPQRL